MIIHVLRVTFILVVLAFTTSFAFRQQVLDKGSRYVTAYILIPATAALGLVVLDMFWRRKRLQLLSGLFFGLLAGLVIAYTMAQVIDLVARVYMPDPDQQALDVIKMLLGTASVFVCVNFVLQTKDDFRFVIPYVEFTKQLKGPRPLLLDTSAIVDGRIADIAETRIFVSDLVVPRFVLAELQQIADSEDKLKRARGRRGLDILNRLQTSENIDVQLLDPDVPAVDSAPDVDAKLVSLARHLDARIMTNDYNLNKVAQLRGVDVININDLANALKPIVLPGETLQVKIIKPGEEAGQGVGYLDDGTMVVAEQGREHIGSDVVIMVTSVLQTSAGRMIFGRMGTGGKPSRRDRTSRR